MRTNKPLFPLFFLLATIISFTSCTRDRELREVNGSQNENSSLAVYEYEDSVDPIEKYGMVQLVVSPFDAGAVVTVYNDSYNSGEQFAIGEVEQGELFIIRELPPGEYAVLITPSNSNYSEVKIESVLVENSKLTDLGIVSL